MKQQGEMMQYECSLDGSHWSSFNATSYGKAKVQFYNYLDGDFDYTYIRCRKVGPIFTSDEFIRNAKYRGIEFAYCGMVIKVAGENGIIVGHNSSANLNVFFPDGKYKGQTQNCHPNWKTEYFDSKGNLIKSFIN